MRSISERVTEKAKENTKEPQKTIKLSHTESRVLCIICFRTGCCTRHSLPCTTKLQQKCKKSPEIVSFGVANVVTYLSALRSPCHSSVRSSNTSISSSRKTCSLVRAAICLYWSRHLFIPQRSFTALCLSRTPLMRLWSVLLSLVR